MALVEDSREDSVVIVDLVVPEEVSDTKAAATDSVDKRRQMPRPDQGVAEVEALEAGQTAMGAVPRVATVNPFSPETDMATATGETETAMVTAGTVTETGIAIATAIATASAIGTEIQDERGTMTTTHTMTPVRSGATEQLLLLKKYVDQTRYDGLLVGIFG
ncbi:hypothetical protein BDV06DRAFT_32834 [Aspergillus oleicola]